MGQRLRSARARLGLTGEDFGKAVGVKKSHISRLESDSTNPSDTLLKAIEMAHGVSAEWIKSGAGKMFSEKAGVYRFEDMPASKIRVDGGQLSGAESDDFVYVPILADEAAAGLPSIIHEEHVVDTAVIHRSWLGRGRHVCFRVRGDSMAPRIGDGFIVAVNLDRDNPERLVGQIVLAYLWEGVTIKYLTKDRGFYMLVPENKGYDPIFMDPKTVRILGVVEWWFGKP